MFNKIRKRVPENSCTKAVKDQTCNSHSTSLVICEAIKMYEKSFVTTLCSGLDKGMVGCDKTGDMQITTQISASLHVSPRQTTYQSALSCLCVVIK